MFELGSTDGGPGVVPVELSEMAAMVDALSAVDVSGLDGSGLRRFVVGLERVAGRFDAVRGRVIAELDQRGHTDEFFGLRTGQWIARETRTPTGVVNRRVTVSRRLADEFPALLAAIADGHISWFHADAFCRAANERIADLMAVLIPELVDLARGMRFKPWCKELRRAAARLDVDGGHDPGLDGDRLYLSHGVDGTREITGRFGGVDGAALEEMLDVETDRQHRLAQELAEHTGDETDIPTRAELRAAALLELLRRGTGATTANGTGGGTAVELTLAHHTHDHTCDHTDNGCTEDDPTAVVRRMVDDLFETTYGDLFRFWQLDTHLCDPIVGLAELKLAGIGDELELHLGRTQRYANRAQRRAAAARDGGCVFPGCDAPVRWCDLHHVTWWENGGLTDIENLACLCRYHHRVTHRAGWSMTALGDGTFTWTTPSGRTLHSEHHGIPSQRAGP